MIGEIEIKDLYIPQGFLPRIITGTKPEKVEEYAEMILNGVEFDPIKVWKNPKDSRYWVADGNHRIQAHLKAGKEVIKAKFIDCKDELDFRRKAIEYNLKHGIPLTREERIENARALYLQGDEPEEIARLFGVSVRTVYNWIGDLKDKEKAEKENKKQEAIRLYNEGYTQQEIAEKLGVPRRTISDWIALAKTEKFQNSPLNPTPEQDTEAEPDWSDWNEYQPEEAQGDQESLATKKQPEPQRKKHLHPDQILERDKNAIWDAVIEIEYHFGEDKALEVLEEIYFAYKERKHKGLTIYKDRRALFIYNQKRGS